ncbi:MAG: hypothetical protein RLW62_09645, partial [Gammaproteobacteria bacterium]
LASASRCALHAWTAVLLCGAACAAGAAGTVSIDGPFSPGNSPGCVVNQGNVVLNPGATLALEIAGPAACSEHDRFTVQQALTINDATLRLVLLDGYRPPPGVRFDLLDWGTLDGSFGRIDMTGAGLADGFAWDLTQLLVDGTVGVSGPAAALPVAVPLPGWALVLLGTLVTTAARAGHRQRGHDVRPSARSGTT